MLLLTGLHDGDGFPGQGAPFAISQHRCNRIVRGQVELASRRVGVGPVRGHPPVPQSAALRQDDPVGVRHPPTRAPFINVEWGVAYGCVHTHACSPPTRPSCDASSVRSCVRQERTGQAHIKSAPTRPTQPTKPLTPPSCLAHALRFRYNGAAGGLGFFNAAQVRLAPYRPLVVHTSAHLEGF